MAWRSTVSLHIPVAQPTSEPVISAPSVRGRSRVSSSGSTRGAQLRACGVHGPAGGLGAQLRACGVCTRVLARAVGASGPWSLHLLHTCPMHRTCVFAPGRGRPRARLSPLGAPAVTGGRGGARLAGRITGVRGVRHTPVCTQHRQPAWSLSPKQPSLKKVRLTFRFCLTLCVQKSECWFNR